MAKKGGKAVFRITRNADYSDLVNLSQPLAGFDGVSFGETEDQGEIPGGGGRVGAQGLGYYERSGSFTIDENTISLPLLFGANGATFYCEYSRDGMASNMPYRRFAAVSTITHTAPTRGKRRFQVSFDMKGVVTDGQHG